MEALFVVLLQALVFVIAPVLTAIAALLASLTALIGSLLSFALQFVLYRQQRPRLGSPPAPAAAAPPRAAVDHPPSERSWPPPSSAQPRRFSVWSRRILVASAVVTGLLLAGLVTVNQWFLGDIARALLEQQRERTGIAITASEIGGNLFSGRFHAHGIVITRSGNGGSAIALTVHSLEVAVPLWRMLARAISIDSLIVAGVRGSILHGTPALPAPPSAGEPAPSGQPAPADPAAEPPPLSPPGHGAKRRFEIASLELSDVNLTYADRTRRHPLVLSVTVDKLSAHPLRSRWAVFDLLFRANANGTINGRPFRITTSGDDLGRTTDWSADGLPVALLASQIGGPFELLSDGRCDLTVHDHWRNSKEERLIVMDWSLVLDHVTAALPERFPPVLAELAQPAITYIDGGGPRLPLSFTAEIAEDRFDFAASWEAAGLWQQVADGYAITLGKAVHLDPDLIKALGRSAAEKARDALDRWRRKPSP
jgi:hypothetical protein